MMNRADVGKSGCVCVFTAISRFQFITTFCDPLHWIAL